MRVALRAERRRRAEAAQVEAAEAVRTTLEQRTPVGQYTPAEVRTPEGEYTPEEAHRPVGERPAPALARPLPKAAGACFEFPAAAVATAAAGAVPQPQAARPMRSLSR